MSRDRQRAQHDHQPAEERQQRSTETAGPQVANRTLAGAVQTKLEVGAAGDRYEQEADRVASRVVGEIAQRHSGHAHDDVQMKHLQRSEGAEMEEEELQMKRIQRSEGAEMEEEELQMSRIQRATAPVVGAEGGTLDQATEAAIARAGAGGRPLDSSLQRDMGSAMGADFSSVRVHTGPKSDQLNSALQSKAFTTGSNVYIRSQDYAPKSSQGQELIAHELTHVVQQGAAPKVERHLDDD